MNRSTRFIGRTLIAFAGLACGCTPQAYRNDLSTDHPAHPEAYEGRFPEPSTTLAVGDAPLAKGQNQPGEALYVCPMHPEVTSPDPSRKCPKCGMKINKPVKDGGSMSGHEGHGGHSQ